MSVFSLVTYHLFIFYEYIAYDFIVQSIPVHNIPWSECQFIHVILDLTGGEDVVPHVDIRYHTKKRLIYVKPASMRILLL